MWCWVALLLLLLICVGMCASRGAAKSGYATGGGGVGGVGGVSEQLAQRGWTVYLRPGCGYCTRQEALLGGARVYPRAVHCGAGAAPAACAAVTAFPTWHNAATGERRVGLQDAGALAQMAAVSAP